MYPVQENLHASRRWPRRAARAAALAGVWLLAAAPQTTSAQGTVIDSLTTALASSNVSDRQVALSQILAPYPVIPAALTAPILSLLNREASTPAAGTGDDDYGEYIIELAAAVVRVGDPAAIRPLVAIGGLEISSGVVTFVASAGPSIIPLLDSVQASPSTGATVVEAFGFMYARLGARLATADSAALLSRLVAAASSPDVATRIELAYVSMRAPLPELVPLLQQLAASDTTRFLPEGVYPVRSAAQEAVDTLSVAWSSLTPAGLLASLIRESAAACALASGFLHGHCQAMRAHLSDVGNHLSDSNTNPARNGIKSFRKALIQAAGSGISAASVTLMDANASRLAQLLGG